MRRASQVAGLAAPLVLVLTLGGCAAQNVRADYDPLEPFNRKMFWVNDTLDVYVLEPTAKGWEFTFNQDTRRAMSNFFQNLVFPVDVVNNALQGKFKNSAVSAGRFAVNTTVGVLGFGDPATGWGLERQRADFGQTLGVWGLRPGPYLVLPFWGPSNFRDAVGLGGDYALGVATYFVPFYYLAAATAVNTVNARSMLLKEVQDVKAAALDYYVLVRNAYFQRRKALVSGKEISDNEADDIYEWEFDEDTPAPEADGAKAPADAAP